MKLYFVRHGETDWNKERRMQGQVDMPLNEFGELLAKKTAIGLEDIPFVVCYTSPLKRARKTAELILAKGNRDTEIIEDDRIIEMAFGTYEGKHIFGEQDEVPQEFHDGFNHPERYVPPEGGESFSDVMRRTQEFLTDICHKEEYRDGNILITTHGAALAGLLANIRGAGLSEYWGIGVHKNCTVTEVLVTESGYQLISENKVYYDDEVEDWRA